MSDLLLQDLKQQIAATQVVVIVGTGVSRSTTNNHPCASWQGLLHSGVDRCKQLVRGLPDGWDRRAHEEINSGDLGELLSAAEKIADKLGAPAGGEYRRWLRETVGTLTVVKREVIEALHNLGVVLATTNYDSLIEEVTGLKPVTWREGAAVEQLVRGDDRGVLHLHGFWKQPESVILGIRSYEKVLGNDHAQNVLHAVQTLKTLLFVGCAEGLDDPNFGTLLKWTGQVFSGSEYRRYCLTRQSEVEKLQKAHPQKQRLFVLSYGEGFDDLALFLRSLVSRPVKPAPSPTTPAMLPSRPRCFGREEELRTLVANLLAEQPEPTPILGPAGIGKSTLTVAALHNEGVATRYGPRRYFVRCDGVKSRSELASAIAVGLGLQPSPSVEPAVLADLARAPAVIAIDNAETPWEADMLAVEEFLSLLSGVPGLALIASLRGVERPAGVNWHDPLQPRVLEISAARETFLAIAGKKFQDDRLLDQLIEAVDRVPLAVTLLAHQAEGEPSLQGLWQRWQGDRTTMLQRAGGKDRLTNIELSYEMSIQSPRMTDQVRRLLKLLALLPGGLAHSDLVTVMPPPGDVIAAALRKTGLAYDEAGRLRLLAPLREYVSRQHPPQVDDRERVVEHYARLSELASKVGGEGGAEAVKRLTPETANIEAMILLRLQGSQGSTAIEAATGWGQFVRFTGLGSARPVEEAVRIAQQSGEVLVAANCIQRLGDIVLQRSDHATATAKFQEALPLFERVGSLLGQANCIKSLGDIAWERSDHATATAKYEEALPLFEQVGSLLGQANCIKSLGDIARECSDHATATAKYQEALPLFERVGSLLGQANCIKSLGDIARERSDHATATAKYEEALPLFERVGSLLGQANCIKSLGDIARECSDHATATAKYEEALPLYERVGSLLGQANCIRGLGDVALQRSQRAEAKKNFEAALTLYERIEEPFSIGRTHRCLARLSHDSERNRHTQASRSAWQKIDRLDLVKELEEEFGAGDKGPEKRKRRRKPFLM